MAITVQHGKDDITTHQGSEKWHIDDDGRLHIVGDNGNIASYNAGYWANVQHAAATPRNPSSADEIRAHESRSKH